VKGNSKLLEERNKNLEKDKNKLEIQLEEKVRSLNESKQVIET
jgi:hypothetical protein